MQLEIQGFLFLLIVLSIISIPFSRGKVFGCGIVGFSGVGNFNKNNLAFLLYWNSIERNSVDSTGYFTPNSGIVKNNIRAEFFLPCPDYRTKLQDDNLFIGHVRAKTIGVNTPENAHPFNFDNITGVHNGTLRNYISLAGKYGLDWVNKYPVDSQILLKCIQRDFKYNDTNKFAVLNKYEGAAALLFHDREEDVLYACHDKERPLNYGYLNGTDMYISSESLALRAIGCDDIKEFPVNTVHKIKDGVILATYPYTPIVNISIPTTRVLNNLAEVKEEVDESNGNIIKVLPEGVKGFTGSAARSWMFPGYWVRVDTRMVLKYLEYDHWYLCVGEGKSNQIIVEDDDGQQVEIGIYQINSSNFIPVRGAFVRPVINITHRDTKEILATPDDVCVVVYHKFGDNKIAFKNLSTDRTINGRIDLVRNLTDDEAKEYIIEFNSKNAVEVIPDIYPQEEDIDDDEAPIDTPFIDADDEDTLDDLLPCGVYWEVLDSLNSDLIDFTDDIADSEDPLAFRLASKASDLIDKITRLYSLKWVEENILNKDEIVSKESMDNAPTDEELKRSISLTKTCSC